MSEARALLEQAVLDAARGWRPRRSLVDAIAESPSGAELIRRADRPEARVAVVEEPCSETMLCPYPQDHPIHDEEGDHDYRPPEPRCPVCDHVPHTRNEQCDCACP